MANSLATTSNGKVVAQRALELLVENYSWIGSGVSDFSDATARKGDAITTHTVSIQSASDYSSTAGYVAGDATQTDVVVTLSNFKHVSYALNDDERTSSSINLVERFAAQAAHALGKSMVDTVLALVTNSNYTTTATIAAGAVTFGSIVDMAAQLNSAKAPMGGRFAVLSPTNYANLSKDTVVVANAQRSTDLVGGASLGEIHGVNVFNYASLPAAVSKGFIAQQEAIIVAARLPEIPNVEFSGTVANVTEAKSGLSLQVRESYSLVTGSVQRTYCLIYGAAKGSASSLVRIV